MNNHILYKCYNCISYTTSRISMSSKPGVIDCPPLLVNNSYYSFQRRTRESAVCLRTLPVSPLVHTERLKWSLHLLLLLLFCLSLSLFSFSSSWGRVISLIVGSHCFRRNLFHGSSVVSGDTHKTNCQRGGGKSPLSKPLLSFNANAAHCFLLAGRISPGISLDGVYLLCKFALKHAHASRDQGQVCLCKCDQEVRRLNMDKARSTEVLSRALILLDLHVNSLNLPRDTPRKYTSTCTSVVLHKNLWKPWKHDLPLPHIWKCLLVQLDPVLTHLHLSSPFQAWTHRKKWRCRTWPKTRWPSLGSNHWLHLSTTSCPTSQPEVALPYLIFFTCSKVFDCIITRRYLLY